MHIKSLLIMVLLFSLIGCAGSPVATRDQTPSEVADLLTGETSAICDLQKDLKRGECFNDFKYKYNVLVDQEEYCGKYLSATYIAIERRGLTRSYCDDPGKYKNFNKPQYEVYTVGTLTVKTESTQSEICVSGEIQKISLEGSINADSSLAIEDLLSGSPHCRDKNGEVIKATVVQLNVEGGYLVDGYKIGRNLRKAGATTLIENESTCGSSCAVAFLGGKERIVEEGGIIRFHTPYYTVLNSDGNEVVSCDIPEAEMQNLSSYYVEMVGKDNGKEILSRTLKYCSSEDGWVVTGGRTAELFGIATQN
jgi:hypothetical protein